VRSEMEGTSGSRSSLLFSHFSSLTHTANFADMVDGSDPGLVLLSRARECTDAGNRWQIALGLAVTDLNGNRISFQRAFARHTYRLLSALILPLLLFLARIVRRPDLILTVLSTAPLLVVLITRRRQTLYDWMTSCVVIHGSSVHE
jgi:hypothetical protein